MKVLVISGMHVVRENLRNLMAAQPEVEIVKDAEDTPSGLQLIEVFIPDVAVLDLQMPLPICMDAVRRMLALNPSLKIIALSMHPDCRYIDECFQAGVCAYVLTDCAYEELADALRAVTSDQKYVSRSIQVPEVL
jgi:DNA-binding NarL/FixJ family response regulator